MYVDSFYPSWWNITHVNYVLTKVEKKIGALWWARRSLSRRSRQVYVKPVIMPDLLMAPAAFQPQCERDN